MAMGLYGDLVYDVVTVAYVFNDFVLYLYVCFCVFPSISISAAELS